MGDILDGITKAISAMVGKSCGNVDMTGYHDAMVFYGQGNNFVGCGLAVNAYTKQLLNCVGTSIDTLATDSLGNTFLMDKRFAHLHNEFTVNKTIEDLTRLVRALDDELRKYVSEDKLQFDTYDIDRWRNELYDKIVDHTSKYVSQSMGECLRFYKSDHFITMLNSDNVKVEECSGYAWIGRAIALRYGFNPDKSYSSLFLRWCRDKGISNIDAKHSWFYSKYDLSTDAELDAIIMDSSVD